MKLVKSLLDIQFTSATHPWLELRDLMRTAASDPKIEMQANPLVLERRNEKTRVSIGVRTARFEQETMESVETAADNARAMMLRLNEASPFPDVGKVRFETISIEPFDLPFHDLVKHMKERFLKPARVTDEASDIALVFDAVDDEVLKHTQLGPMDRTQLLSEFLKWGDPKDVPDAFVFILLAYEWTHEAVAFSEGALGSFLSDAVNWQEAEGESLVRELKEGVS